MCVRARIYATLCYRVCKRASSSRRILAFEENLFPFHFSSPLAKSRTPRHRINQSADSEWNLDSEPRGRSSFRITKGLTLSYTIYKRPSRPSLAPPPSSQSPIPPREMEVGESGRARHPISRPSDAQEFANWIFSACPPLPELRMYR